MTATITRIENGKVYAKSVNPLGEKPEPHHYNVPLGHMASITSKWQVDYNKWQQAESERQELELHEDEYYKWLLHDKHVIYSLTNENKIDLYPGLEIQVTREGDYFKII